MRERFRALSSSLADLFFDVFDVVLSTDMFELFKNCIIDLELCDDRAINDHKIFVFLPGPENFENFIFLKDFRPPNQKTEKSY